MENSSFESLEALVVKYGTYCIISIMVLVMDLRLNFKDTAIAYGTLAETATTNTLQLHHNAVCNLTPWVVCFPLLCMLNKVYKFIEFFCDIR